VRRRARLLPDDKSGLVLELARGEGECLTAYFNLSDRRQPLLGGPAGPRKVLFRSEATWYCGARREFAPAGDLTPHECLVPGPATWRAFV
jgi:hypothetical protein